MRLLSAVLAFAAVLSVKTAVAQTVSPPSELDNEAQVTNEQIAMSKDIPSTLVVRQNAATGEVQVLHANAKLAADASSLSPAAPFATVDASAITNGELDQDSSSSSWYFWFNRGWNYPNYYYGGYRYNYRYYGGYNYRGWNYSYYRWNYGWWY